MRRMLDAVVAGTKDRQSRVSDILPRLGTSVLCFKGSRIPVRGAPAQSRGPGMVVQCRPHSVVFTSPDASERRCNSSLVWCHHFSQAEISGYRQHEENGVTPRKPDTQATLSQPSIPELKPYPPTLIRTLPLLNPSILLLYHPRHVLPTPQISTPNPLRFDRPPYSLLLLPPLPSLLLHITPHKMACASSRCRLILDRTICRGLSMDGVVPAGMFPVHDTVVFSAMYGTAVSSFFESPCGVLVAHGRVGRGGRGGRTVVGRRRGMKTA